MAAAPSCPGYQAATTAFTLSSQGMATGLPVPSTTMVLGLAAATAAMIASCPPGSDRSRESKPSASYLLTKTIATSDRAQSAAASSHCKPGSQQTFAADRASFTKGHGTSEDTRRRNNCVMTVD